MDFIIPIQVQTAALRYVAVSSSHVHAIYNNTLPLNLKNKIETDQLFSVCQTSVNKVVLIRRLLI